MKSIDKIYFKNPKKHIPDGAYCYKCIFWDKDETKLPQNNGYCHYLKQGDWDTNGLLWDMIKECSVKNYSKWCLDCQHSKWNGDDTVKCMNKNQLMNSESVCDEFEPQKELL